MTWILRLIAGPAGTYILIGLAALIFAGGTASAVQSWRLKSAKTEIVQTAADLNVCRANGMTLQASLNEQNAKVKGMEADAARGSELAQAKSDAVLAKPISVAGGNSPKEVTQWFAQLLSPH